MLTLVALALLPVPAGAASERVASLETELQPPAITTYQITQYLARRTPTLSMPTTGADWTVEARRLRWKRLEEVIPHGWPREWVGAPARIEDLGVVASTPVYRIRKLRYEIVPGYRAPAILCEPARATRPVPGVLNPIGHEAAGKAVAHAQHRCAAFAKLGMVALSPEWPGFGELTHPDNAHDFAAHLDLVGANGIGFFYLTLPRALAVLAHRPHVDLSRRAARAAADAAHPQHRRRVLLPRRPGEAGGRRRGHAVLRASAAALEPRTLDAVVTRDALPSLRALLDERVHFRVAPEVFCLDLYREFDVDRLTALAEPTKIYREGGRQ